MFKLLIAAFAAAVLGLGGASLAGSLDLDQASATTGTTTTGTTTTGATTTREAGEDVRGPCDEAEHAGDPRCTGTATNTPRGDDRRGRRGRDDKGSSGRNRSGSNRGKG